MGEVFRAEDAALGREVAIKVLPPAFTGDAERLARFEREARLLASLSHPNVAGIFEIGHQDGTHFLVMELAAGETLAARLARGPLPLDEALPIALQIAQALEAAHERGIVHRDLKPGNVMVDPDGRVKVLDFGLAKALGAGGGDGTGAAQLAQSPTLTYQPTVGGVLLGTAAYMSPEQAKGRPADRRADVWAFGVVLWETLTGERLFSGETVSDVLAAVLRADVDFAKLPPQTPPEIRRLLRRCLARDPAQRLHDIADARLEIAEALAGGPEPAVRRRARPPWLAVALGAVALGLAGLVGWLAGRPAPSPAEPAIRLPLALPEGFRPAVRIHHGVAISPDGRRQVVVAYGPDGTDVLVARDLGEVEARVLEGTAGAHSPFFSPDGEWVGFFTADEMRRAPFAGGPVERLAAATGQDRGAAWGPDGTIHFAPNPEGGLFRVAPGAGPPSQLTTLDTRRGERTHRWPHVLPGGRHVLFTSDTIDTPQAYDDARLEAVAVATGERRVVLEGASRGAYLAGHLLFARGGALFAAPFDAARLEVTGEPELVLQGVSATTGTGATQFAVSDSGALLYVPGAASHNLRRVVWATGQDTVTPAGIADGSYFQLALAPDGRRVALSVAGERRNDLWIADLERRTLNRLTFGGGMTPAWSPDGARIAFQRSSSAAFLPQDSKEVLWKAADGSDEERVLWRSETPISPNSFLPDGTALIVHRSETPTTAARTPAAAGAAPDRPVSRDVVAGAADLWLVPLDGTPARPLVRGPGFQYGAELSPDGRWLAYLSDESGRYEVYVRRFPGPGGRWQVSTAGGGMEPHWSKDGRALYYRHRRDLLRVPVERGEAFSAGSAERVASGLIDGTNPRTYSVTADGRVLFLQVLGRADATQPVLVLGFDRELSRRRGG